MTTKSILTMPQMKVEHTQPNTYTFRGGIFIGGVLRGSANTVEPPPSKNFYNRTDARAGQFLPIVNFLQVLHPSSVARLTFLAGLKALIYSSIKSSFQTLDNRYNIKRFATPLIYLTILFGSILKVKCKVFLSRLRL